MDRRPALEARALPAPSQHTTKCLAMGHAHGGRAGSATSSHGASNRKQRRCLSPSVAVGRSECCAGCRRANEVAARCLARRHCTQMHAVKCSVGLHQQSNHGGRHPCRAASQGDRAASAVKCCSGFCTAPRSARPCFLPLRVSVVSVVLCLCRLCRLCCLCPGTRPSTCCALSCSHRLSLCRSAKRCPTQTSARPHVAAPDTPRRPQTLPQPCAWSTSLWCSSTPSRHAHVAQRAPVTPTL